MTNKPSSVPSARTVTRYTLLDDSVLDVNSGRAITVYGGTEVYLASEVDPLLTALANMTEERNVLFHTCGDAEDRADTYKAALAEREQEIERLREGVDQIKNFYNQQIQGLTARAEAADATIAQYRARYPER